MLSMKAALLLFALCMSQFPNTFQQEEVNVAATTNGANTLIQKAKSVLSEAVSFRKKMQKDASTVWKKWKVEFKKPYDSQRTLQEARRKESYSVVKNETNRGDPGWTVRMNDIIGKHTPSNLEEFNQKLRTFMKFVMRKQREFEQIGTKITGHWEEIQAIGEWINSSEERLGAGGLQNADVAQMESQLYLLTKQIQSQQFNEEEKTRSDGFSGIKQVRVRYSGGKNYFSSTHTGRSFASIHDHSNNIRTVGMGEFIGVMNGNEFRTRHNDYSLRKPVSNDKTFNKVENIEFPDVPPSVLNKATVDGQVEEMRKWFQAFKDQDFSVRNYRKYFKPILCYLEGSWTSTTGDLDEPFESSRHHIDAKTWFELQEKIQFTSYTGTKNLLENLAHLPTKIMGFTSKKKPIFAQWNYRILCHPLKDDLPTSFLKVISDPATQKMNGWDAETFANSRAARFDIEGVNYKKRRSTGPLRYTYLDTLMEEIPGKDNYGASLVAEGFDSDVVSANPANAGKLLNGAYYNRAYKLKEKDAMGVANAQRSYSDKLYVAMTSQPNIAGPSFNDSKGRHYEAKVSYAIPMEIIYLTPLAKWNPYNIKYVDDWKNVMTGTGTKDDPYVSSDPRHFFWTPDSLFTGQVETDAADTSKSAGVYIKNVDGETVKTHASGVRINFPTIKGIEGIIRQRYPIMPIHGEGSSIWKRINAFEDSVEFSSTTPTKVKYLTVEVSNPGPNAPAIATQHTHLVELEQSEYDYLMENKGERMVYTTSQANTHSHTVEIFANANKEIEIEKCDGKTRTQIGKEDHVCFDNHPVILKVN